MTPKNDTAKKGLLAKWIPGTSNKPNRWRQWKRILTNVDTLASSYDKNGKLTTTVDDVIAMLKTFGIRDWEYDLLGRLVMEVYIEISVNEDTAKNLNTLINDLEEMYARNREIFDSILERHPDLWGSLWWSSKKLKSIVPKKYQSELCVTLVVKD